MSDPSGQATDHAIHPAEDGSAIDRTMRPLRKALRWLGLALLAAMIALPALQVVLRATPYSFIGAGELTRFMLICVVFATLPYVVSSGANIRVEDFSAALPTSVQRLSQRSSFRRRRPRLRLRRLLGRGRGAAQPRQRDADPRHAVLDLLLGRVRRPPRWRRSNAPSSSSRPCAAATLRELRGGAAARGRARDLSRETRHGGGRGMSIAVIAAFGLFFLLGWPVVLAILLPAIALCRDQRHSDRAGRPAHVLRARFLPAGGGADLHLRRQFHEPGRHHERIFRFADTLVGRVPGGLGQVNISRA